MLRSSLIILALIGSFSSVWAADDDDDGNSQNSCGRLHIQIGNALNQSCQLRSKQVIHGNLITSPPVLIAPGFSARFDMRQTFYGPDIILEYRCHGESISFSSQQNYCFMKAGKITGKVFTNGTKLRATYTAEPGSAFWGRPGLISWVISE